MKYTFILFLLLALITNSNGESSKSESQRGVSVSAGIGSPTVNIKNPNGSDSYYSGFSLEGNGYIPVVDAKGFGLNLVASARYLDLQNTANTSEQTEIANQIGAGPGIYLRFFGLWFGADYLLAKERHYLIGLKNKKMEADLKGMNLSGGLSYQFNRLSIGLKVSQYSSIISKDATDLSNDSPYKDQVVTLQLFYNSGESFGNFLSKLFK